MSQFIISLGREFGSGGHELAERLSKHYEIPMYDHNLLDEIAKQKNVSSEVLKEFDEVKKIKGLYRTVRNMSSAPSDQIAQMQFDFIREKAASGESFVIVGRCSESILKEYPGLITLFINGDMEQKIIRVMRIYNLSQKEASDFIKKKDRKRKEYHNSHCDNKWGDSRNYELSINSSKLGIEGSLRILIDYIDARKAVISHKA